MFVQSKRPKVLESRAKRAEMYILKGSSPYRGPHMRDRVCCVYRRRDLKEAHTHALVYITNRGLSTETSHRGPSRGDLQNT